MTDPARLSRPSVSYIVPARNEAGTIRRIVEELPVLGASTEIIFIENNSRDDTLLQIRDVAESYRGQKTIRYDAIRCTGKVEAVMHGFGMARGDILMIYDADMTVPPDEMSLFYAAVKEGRGVMANGSRLVHEMEEEAMRPLNYVGNKTYAALLSMLLRTRLSDVLCGTKAFWREDYELIRQARARYHNLDPFGDFDLLLGAGLAGFRIVEVPVHYKARTYGTTNIRRIKNGLSLFLMLGLAFFDIGLYRAVWR
jgi:glycosyltransferase involved in cell wall biosynthesis